VRHLALAVLALALAGCTPGHTAVDVKTHVAVTISPSPDVLPFDPASARLVQVQNQLTELAGHTVQLIVDAALVPDFKSDFEEALDVALENVVRDLGELRTKEPAAFAYAVPMLTRVEARYDAAASVFEARLDPPSKGVLLSGPAHRDALVPRGAVYGSLLAAYAQYVTTRFANVGPDAVAPAERAAYLEFLTGYVPGRGYPKDDALDSPAALASSPHATRILSVLRLAELDGGRDPKLGEALRHWIFEQLDWFLQRYHHDAALVRALPADCAFHRAEAGFVKWLLGAYPTLPEDKKLEVAKAVFVRSFETDRAAQGGRTYAPFAFPGIDPFAFGLKVIDEWRAAGHPTQLSPGGTKPLFELFACPHPIGERGSRSLGPHCDYDWYRFAFDTDAGRKRLVEAVVERNDPAFTEVVFLNVWNAAPHPLDVTIAMLRAVEDHTAVWRVGFRLLADERGDVSATDLTLLEEARRLWLERPDRRDLVLYLLAQMDRYDHGDVDWRGFATSFGGPVTDKELGAYLELGSRAMSLLPVLWPALGKFPRAAIVVPHLDAFLGDARVRGYDSSDPHRALGGIVARMCAERGTADLAAMHAYLEQRVSGHPGETFASIADDATDAKCKPPPPSPPPRNIVRLGPPKRSIVIDQRPTPPGVP